MDFYLCAPEISSFLGEINGFLQEIHGFLQKIHGNLQKKILTGNNVFLEGAGWVGIPSSSTCPFVQATPDPMAFEGSHSLLEENC